ncbi:MAG TPA: carboxymuconolactone decarboxylase family protein [Bordetella sp.]|nr:carboxymuconolactone decarboxylase family protein [Bordetella sp.]
MSSDKRLEEKQAYLDKLVKDRGYVLDYHKILVKHDFDAMTSINQFLETVYLKDRALDRRTKELLSIFGLIQGRAARGQIQSHMRVAVDLGVTPKELLELVELVLPMSGFATFQVGFSAWCDFFQVDGIEPTVARFEGGSPA